MRRSLFKIDRHLEKSHMHSTIQPGISLAPLLAALALASASCLAGCVDLSEPRKLYVTTVGTGGSSEGGAGAVEQVGTGQGGAGGEINVATGGSGGFLDASQAGAGGGLDPGLGGTTGSIDEAIDAALGGAAAGGTVVATGGVATGGTVSVTGGIVELPIGGAGGAATGGAIIASGGDTSVAGAGGTVIASGGEATGGTVGGDGSTGGGSGGTVTGDVDAAPPASGGGLSAGLVVYYPCDQMSGSSLLDMSGHSPANNGTLLDTPSEDGGVVPGYSFAPGKVGSGSLVLTGSGYGYVSMPPNVLAGATEATIATWVYLTTAQPYQRIFDIGIDGKSSTNPLDGTTNRYMNMVPATYSTTDAHRKLTFYITNSGRRGEQSLAATTIFPTATWTHVAVVLGPRAVSLYINGAVAATSSTVTLRPVDIGLMDYAYIGKSQFSENPDFDGQFDDYRIYNRALSSGEIRALSQFSGH